MLLIMDVRKIILNTWIFRFMKGVKNLYRVYVASMNRSKFGYIDKTVYLAPPLHFSNPANVYLMGYNTLKDAKIFSTNAKFIMKHHSGVAEGFRVSTGNHAVIKGRWLRDVRDNEKPKGYDKDVVIESDVWIGRNVTILQGVTVGRGAIVGAGSVLRKSVPPYAIVIGNPAKVVGFKLNPKEIIEHEAALYEESERFSIDFLEKNYKKYFLNRIKEIRSFHKL